MEGGAEPFSRTSSASSASVSEQIVDTRRGAVLGKGTILKSDHFPGAQNMKLSPIIDGAPNFRQVEGVPVYGVAIPTVEGVMNVLQHIERTNPGQAIHWHNMREEPVLYINGKPFVLRELERPFANVEYTGISQHRVEQMEERMKGDVLVEVARYGGVMVCNETDGGDLTHTWEAVEHGDVQTPAQVYQELRRMGLDVTYFRIPVTDERSPKEVDFDMLMKYCSAAGGGSGVARVFNCQMGRGRTTTAMIVATMLHLRSLPARRLPAWALPAFGTEGCEVNSQAGSPASRRTSLEPLPLEGRLRSGDFVVIRSLLRVVERGRESKAQVDAVIDACAAFQSIREGICVYRERFLKAATEGQRNNLQRVVIDYLERYFMLITFTSYLNTAGPDVGGGKPGAALTFEQWTTKRDELYSVKRRLLWHNPLTAMEVSAGGSALPEREEAVANFIATRSGSVLGADTVLKEDHFPGLRVEMRGLGEVEGAPNFRRACDGLPVFGLGMPTEDGVRNALHAMGAEPGSSGRVLWFNMREEPVVYVNGKPYVLRELSRPFKNLQEYAHISTPRVESMEKRLKQDIVQEAWDHDNSVLVTREVMEGDDRRVVDDWEKVAPLGEGATVSVRTTQELFSSLSSLGYPVDYVRIPMTDGKAPSFSDLDAVTAEVAASEEDTKLVFSCQGGAGRTTTGMVLGSLLHLRRRGRLTDMNPAVLRERCGRESVSTDDPEIFDVKRDHGFSDEEAEEGGEGGEGSKAEQRMKEGSYAVVQRLLYLLSRGAATKTVVDQVIDACGKLKNLRQAIFAYRHPRKNWGPSWGKGDEVAQSRHAAFKRGIEYLERYFILVAFAWWLDDESYQGGAGSFYEWFKGRGDLRELRKTIRTNPSASLAVSGSASEACAEFFGTDYEFKACLGSRTGALLKSNTILKSYGSAGIQSSSLQSFAGVYNFLSAQHVPVFTCAAPSVDGMRTLLSEVGAGQQGLYVLVVDLREDLVIYVNGHPYVLRELTSVARKIKLTGISGEQVSSQERELRSDVREESELYGGKVLLHHEVPRPQRTTSMASGLDEESAVANVTRAFDHTPGAQHRQFTVEGFWEETGAGGRQIQTSEDVFGALQAEGVCLEYVRCPRSRERSPTPHGVEQLHLSISDFFRRRGRGAKVLFLSHTGRGSGVRYAPVIAGCYWKLCMGASSTISGEPASGDQGMEGTENRGIFALVRVIPDGPSCKSVVDEVIRYFKSIGDIHEDILRCKETVESLAKESRFDELNEAYIATRQLGLNYLKRYFYLVLYVCYLKTEKKLSFAEWVGKRNELSYLSAHLTLE